MSCPGCTSRLHWKEENANKYPFTEWLLSADSEEEE